MLLSETRLKCLIPSRNLIQSNPLLIAAAAAAAAAAAQKCCCPKQGSNVLFPSALPLASAKQRHNEVLAGGSETAKHHALKDGTTSKSIARTSSLEAGMSLLKSY